MNINPALAVQEALYALLSSDTALLSLLGGLHVHDDVPPKRAFPYVTIGDIETSDWSTQTQRGYEHIVTLNAWSRYAGRKQLHQIIALIDDIIESQALDATGFNIVNQRIVFWTALRDPDGETYRGIMRLRIVTEPLD